MQDSDFLCKAARTYKRLIIEHTGFNTLTPSGGSSCPNYFWLSDVQFARLQPLLPGKVRSVPRVDDRKVISGIIYVIRYGLRWRDAPACYGPHKTLYNRFARWMQGRLCSTVSFKPWPQKAPLLRPS